jgi:Glycosyltransferases involved in cell wall biogenesis
MDQPLVSIALCTYNGEKFLRKQIDSLLAQTYPHIEVIVCDDASSDGTAGILNSYTDPGMIKYFNPENIGYIRNFEQAIRHCTGQYIAICDQDDVWKENKIERMLNSIDDAWLLFSDSELIDEQGLQLGKKLSDLRNLITAMYSPPMFGATVSGVIPY